MFPGNSENLILTGFMGTGKTAVGRALARRLGRAFVDMDAIIEERAGEPIARIFAEEGEAAFRRMEADLCRELAAQQGLVIATGGGALLPEDNLAMVRASGPVICLTASPEAILRRLANGGDRPLLNAHDRRARIAALLAERAEAYGRIPLQIDTTGLSVKEVAYRILALAPAPPTHTLPVRHPGGVYPVHLGRGLLAQTGPLLRELDVGGSVALVTNPTVEGLHAGPAVESLEKAGFKVTLCTVPDGEAHKRLGTVRGLYDDLIAAGLDRRSPVVALGGGVIGDMAGFAAATYLRGVPLVQLPTTLLAMVDASVGGKVAVDHSRGKNLIGAFKQPAAVLVDPDALATLPEAEFAGGLAEVIKAGVIGDPALFRQIESHGPAPLPWIIERAIRVKRAVVEGDPYERGRRAVLNLGHTFGHALELLSGYALPHGQGVSIGLVAAARLSARMGLCEKELAARIERVLTRLGLPTTFRGHTPAQVWRAMGADKKRRGKKLRFVLPRALGDVIVTDDVAQNDVLEVLASLVEM
jgi:3-dehydroquinate synthase